jgi:hypothetical protein
MIVSRHEAVADGILSNLKEIFGWSVYDILIRKITKDYLQGKTDIRTAMIEQPALFEHAFVRLIGPLGEKFLADVCEKVQLELGLDDTVTYSRNGDFARYITAVSRT